MVEQLHGGPLVHATAWVRHAFESHLAAKRAYRRSAGISGALNGLLPINAPGSANNGQGRPPILNLLLVGRRPLGTPLEVPLAFRSDCLRFKPTETLSGPPVRLPPQNVIRPPMMMCGREVPMEAKGPRRLVKRPNVCGLLAL